MKISEVMTPDPIVIEVPNRRSLLLRLMAKNRKTGLPAVKKGTMEFVGMVTREDILANPEINQVALLTNKNCSKVSPDEKIESAIKIITTTGKRHLPVVKGKKVVGIITPTNLLNVIISKGVKTPVSKLKTRPCVPAWRETPISVVAEIMRITGINALVVLDNAGKITGIVTDRDILNLTMIERFTEESLSGSGEDNDPWSWEGIRDLQTSHRSESRVNLPPIPVDQIITRNPVSVFERATASLAAELMLKYDYSQLPIRDNDDRLCGMCYDIDLIRCLL